MKKILIVIILTVGAGVAWWLGSPLFINEAVDEELDFEIDTSVVTEEPAVEIDVASLTDEEIAAMSDEEKKAAEMKLIEMAEAEGDTVMDDEMPKTEGQMPEVRVLSRGEFSGSDALHQGEGTAIVIERGTERIIRFEDFDVTNGPKLHVLLSTEKNPSDSRVVGEYIDLGELKGNVGNQNYLVPEGIDISQYKSVVIYCKPFQVVFAGASI